MNLSISIAFLRINLELIHFIPNDDLAKANCRFPFYEALIIEVASFFLTPDLKDALISKIIVSLAKFSKIGFFMVYFSKIKAYLHFSRPFINLINHLGSFF